MQTVKMVVTGPFNSGKTAFIQSVSEIDVVSTERKISTEAERIKETTTVAMDFGRITVDDDLVLYFRGRELDPEQPTRRILQRTVFTAKELETSLSYERERRADEREKRGDESKKPK